MEKMAIISKLIFLGYSMPSNAITIKPNNHRIYQCPNEKKIALVNKLIEENSDLDILVVCANDAKELADALENKDVKVIEDRVLIKEKKDLKCEFLISYDMPIKAIVYMARVARASQRAVLLLSKSEQKELHTIETLLGRAIKQERLEGFEYAVAVKPVEDTHGRKKLSKKNITEIARKRHEDATVEKLAKPKREFKKGDEAQKGKWEKKNKKPNKFLGKDENGKAIFSGKSGERNHRYDGTPREKWDAPKKVGKTISIKERKAKD